ncbi:MAG TPA: diphosphomevalonate decarboxylase [Ardenticatenaceae bacterium]|jgi:diphosphomevalonate decarboxylase
MQTSHKATARAKSNLAFIKYWGARDSALNVPLNDSVSMTLDAAYTLTTVEFDTALNGDVVVIDGQERDGDPLIRASRHLSRLRALAGVETPARVVSKNNFPMAAGIASSASAFAALTVAASAALGLALDAREMSRLARLESGSASRSLYGGFVEWHGGRDHKSSYAEPIASEKHWPDLRDVVAIVTQERKKVSSAEGHGLAQSSPFLQARLEQVARQLPTVRTSILECDLATLGPIIEADALAMHFVMMSGTPPLFYWSPATIALIKACQEWREQGLQVYFTIDAGPNVHLLCEAHQEAALLDELQRIEGVERVLVSGPGGAPQLLDDHLF